MLRTLVPVFLITVLVSFSFAACGRDSEDECADCGMYGGGAVKCFVGLGPPQILCGPDETNAAIQCTEGGGTYVPLTLCPLDAETGDGPGHAPWQPGQAVLFDPDSGQYVIDELSFEELKLDPAPLFLDSSELRLLESGHYQVATAGELSEALGWHTGDILLTIDGYRLGSLADFAAAYTALAEKRKFALTILRGREKVVLRYRVE